MKNFLTPQEQNGLKSRHRLEKNRRNADRIKAVLLSDQGWTFREIAHALLLDEETISRHLNDYIKKQKLKLESGGSKSKLDKKQTEDLIFHLEETTYTKIQDICFYVEKKFGVIYTVPGMTSWMYQNGFSYKKPKGIPAKADPLKQEAFIKYYNDLWKSLPEKEVILFGDGVHPTMATKVSYGWIRKGQDKPIPTTASRTRLNLMGSLNLENMEVIISSHDTIDSVSMSQHFRKIRKNYPEAPKIHLILDQGPYNTSEDTKRAAQEYNIILHYLPSYSPNLNPIERLWKVMNEYSRNNRFFKTASEFRQEIFHFFDVTWPKISLQMVDRINDSFSPVKSTLSI